MSQTQINVSQFATVFTISFVNKSQNGMGDATPIVWVCQSKAAYEHALTELRGMSHVKICDHGPSHFVYEGAEPVDPISKSIGKAIPVCN